MADLMYHRAMAGLPGWERDSRNVVRELPLARWAGGLRATATDRRVDAQLLARCTGPTLDLGCGPGRLTAMLCTRGIAALGVDLSMTAIEWTARRGGTGLCRNFFAPLPHTGGWAQVLLADGNIGIGGDPVRLLRRTTTLLRPGGTVIAEIDSQRRGLRRERRRWETDDVVGEWFPWAAVGADTIGELARCVGLRLLNVVEVGVRLIVHLRKPDGGRGDTR